MRSTAGAQLHLFSGDSDLVAVRVGEPYDPADEALYEAWERLLEATLKARMPKAMPRVEVRRSQPWSPIVTVIRVSHPKTGSAAALASALGDDFAFAAAPDAKRQSWETAVSQASERRARGASLNPATASQEALRLLAARESTRPWRMALSGRTLDHPPSIPEVSIVDHR